MSDVHILNIRLTAEEKRLLEEAARVSLQPGERGGASTWMRKLCVREAKKVVDEFYAAVKMTDEQGQGD